MSRPSQADEYAGLEAEYLAKSECPAGGGRLRLEHWDSHGPTMACGVCDCFGYEPTDPRLAAVGSPTENTPK